MRGHVDAESLALYAEGLLSRRESARIRTHLSGCPECAAAQQQLTGVTALLGQVPAAPLPPAVAARLDLALTAEVARRAAEPSAAATTAAGAAWPADAAPAPAPPAPPATPAGIPAGTAGSPAPSGHARRQARGRGHQAGTGRTGTRRWGLRSPATLRLVSVAAAAVVLAAGGYGLSRLSSSPGSSSSASSAAAPSAQRLQAGALPVFSSGTRYHPHTLGQQASSALAEYHQGTPAQGAIQGGPAQGAPSASTPDGGGQAVTGPATRRGAHRLAPLVSPAEEATLQGCAAAVADGRTVELVDRASYAGRPAIIIVLAARGSQPATVWVTGPRCSAGHPEKIIEGPLGGG
jgi:hypothetical protein